MITLLAIVGLLIGSFGIIAIGIWWPESNEREHRRYIRQHGAPNVLHFKARTERRRREIRQTTSEVLPR